MASLSPPTSSASHHTDILDYSADTAQQSRGTSIGSFVASSASTFAIFSLELMVFLIIGHKLARVCISATHLPRFGGRTDCSATARLLVMGAHRTYDSRLGSDIQMRPGHLLLPALPPHPAQGLLILPIIIPINHMGGRGPSFATNQSGNSTTWTNVDGLDRLATLAPCRTTLTGFISFLAWGLLFILAGCSLTDSEFMCARGT